MNFYTKVVSKFMGGKGPTLTVRFELPAQDNVSQQKVEDAKVALRELGLDDTMHTG
jgi:hypothetical protein